jgi:hypothetical protein
MVSFDPSRVYILMTGMQTMCRSDQPRLLNG